MGNARRLLNGGAIGATALLLALLLVALPQAAWADEASDDTESGLAAPVSSVESSDDALIAGGDTTASDKGKAAPVGADDADASGSEIDTVVDNDMTAVDDVDGEGSDTSGEVAADDADDTASDPAAESVQATSEDAETVQGHWVVKDLGNGYGLQRYWYDASGSMAKNRLITPKEGAGYYAYATEYGYVVRGTWDNGAGRVYIADNDGLLAQGKTGWLVTGAYTNGELQRYYIDEVTHAAKSSYFTVEGYGNCFGLGGKGYVLRGAGSGYNSKSQASQLYADNDGKLATSKWVCTDAFGQGFQRYWFDSTSAMAKGRLVAKDEGAGYYAYATSNGYVLRGTLDSGFGYVYVADNDGKLLGSDMESDGWVVTGAYTNGELQRYYVLASRRAVRTSFFEVSGTDNDGMFFGQGGVGYVYRNTAVIANNKIYHADNNGVLTEFSSGDATLDGYLLEIYTKYGTNLRTLFDYVASYPYISGSKWPTGEWSISFAKEMYENHGGNCYRYAALFCWLAKGLGYDADVVAGEVAISGGRAAHGWTEVYIDGKTYICDSRFEREVGGGYNWFMTTYATAAVTYIK